jgi:hypothetical protein
MCGRGHAIVQGMCMFRPAYQAAHAKRAIQHPHAHVVIYAYVRCTQEPRTRFDLIHSIACCRMSRAAVGVQGDLYWEGERRVCAALLARGGAQPAHIEGTHDSIRALTGAHGHQPSTQEMCMTRVRALTGTLNTMRCATPCEVRAPDYRIAVASIDLF